MQKWEYKLVEGWQTIDQLSALGSEDWELVSTEVGVGNHNMGVLFQAPRLLTKTITTPMVDNARGLADYSFFTFFAVRQTSVCRNRNY